MHVLPLYLPPVLVPAFLAWVFGQTLLPGRTPLIEQLVHVLHAPDAVPGACRAGVCTAPDARLDRAVRGAGVFEPAAGRARRARRPAAGRRLHAARHRAAGMVVAVREPDRLRASSWRSSLSSTLTGGGASRASPIATCSSSYNACSRPCPGCSDARRDERRSRSPRHRAHSRHASLRSPDIFPGGRSCRASCCCNVCCDEAERWLGRALSVRALPQAKFSAPLLPEQSAELELRLAGNELRFSVTARRAGADAGPVHDCGAHLDSGRVA